MIENLQSHLHPTKGDSPASSVMLKIFQLKIRQPDFVVPIIIATDFIVKFKPIN